MMKRLVLIAALLAVVSVPAVAQGKALIHFVDKTSIRVSAGPQLLVEPFRPAGINPFENILVQGEVDPSVRYYIAPKAKVVDGIGNKKNALTRMTSFRVEYLPIENVGGPPVLMEPIVWEGIIDYSHPDEDGQPVIRDPSGHPLARTVIAGVVSYYLIRETTEGAICLAINLTAGIPVCWNVPWFKSDESGAIFDPEDFDAAMEKVANPNAFRGWLEIIPNSHDLAWVRWQITYEAKEKKTSMAWETKPQSGIFVFDYDSDGYRNDYEIEMGTDPYDPNSHPGGPTLVSVPSVVGKTTSEAEALLGNANLILGTVTHTFSATVPVGKIISQAPVATSQVLVGSAVNVVVSDGPQPPTNVSTPNIVGKTPTEAGGILGTAGLYLGTLSYAYSDTCPAGLIISQNPLAGVLVPVGSSVNATVSLGSQLVSVPSVVGKTTSEASSILQAANLVLDPVILHTYSETVPAGKIISQSPVAGSQVLPNSAVNVTVSDGPQPPNALVVTITSPTDNFVGTIGQTISFACTVSGGTAPYYNFKWHFPDNSFKYQQNVSKTFDFPGAGWCYIDVTDHAGNVAQDKVWVQINTAP